MEADGSSPPACEYCALHGHRSDECRTRRFDRRLDGVAGFVGTVLLLPFNAIGWVIGTIVSGFKVGFDAGFAASAWVRDRLERWSRG